LTIKINLLRIACYLKSINLIEIVIHVSQIKSSYQKLQNKRRSRSKIFNVINLEKLFNFKLSSNFNRIIKTLAFLVVTLLIFFSISLLNSNSNLETQANENSSVRIITNFYYNQNKSDSFQAEIIE
jgi:hypothetical protein